MKIALVNSEYPSVSGSGHGGIATYTLTLARLLAGLGHSVHVLCRNGFTMTTPCPSVKFHTFGASRNRTLFARIAARLFHIPFNWEKGQACGIMQLLSGLSTKEHLDIVEFPEYGGLAAYFNRSRKIPLVITFHTPSLLVDTFNNITPTALQRSIYRLESLSISRATVFKSPSNTLKEYACSHYNLPPSSVTLLKNPFDDGIFKSIYRPEKKENGCFDILFSGRLERRKGADILLTCIKEILAIGDDITFTIAGDTEIGTGRNFQHAIEHILSPSERERVWFPGSLSREKLLPLYCNSSLFLFPSLFENAPYALLEAMAAGLPVVATSVSGIAEIVTHNENGLLFSPDNRSELLSCIRRLHNDRPLAVQLGKNAEKTIKLTYNPEKSAKDHCSFYESVIERNR